MKRNRRHAQGIAAIRRTVRARMRRQAPDIAHDYLHIERVWRNAETIALRADKDEGWEIDGDVLECAVLLHELGGGHGAGGDMGPAEQMLRAERLDEIVWPVCEAILTHDGEEEPRSNEARVLADANHLDALGAIGVLRATVRGVSHAVPALYDMKDPHAQSRPPDDAAYVLDSFPLQLFHLPDAMHTAWSREEASRRARFLRRFYDEILREAGRPAPRRRQP